MRPWIGQPEMQNRRLDPTGLAKPGETRGLMGMRPNLERQEAAGGVSGRFWNQTEQFFQTKPGPLAGYPDPFLSLNTMWVTHLIFLNANYLLDNLKLDQTEV